MGVRVRGLAQSKRQFNRWVRTVTGKRAVRALAAANAIIAPLAALYTPIDTSTLLNSQYQEVIVTQGVRVTGRVGYSANYAVYVHDPNVPQNFRRKTAKKEFLVKAVMEERENIQAAIVKEMAG